MIPYCSTLAEESPPAHATRVPQRNNILNWKRGLEEQEEEAGPDHLLERANH